MYLEKLKIRNYGPIDSFDYQFSFDENHNPLPTILIGKNGTGKTLILSNILNSIIEIKRKFFDHLKEVDSNKYYRFTSKVYIKSGCNEAYENIEYTNANFTELMIRNYDKFKSVYNDNEYPNISINDTSLKNDGFFEKLVKPNTNIFRDNIFLYFPVDRYYVPTWENTDNDKLKFVTNDLSIMGESTRNIIKYNILDEVEEWILDVIIDKMLYEKYTLPYSENNTVVYKSHYTGKNTTILIKINELLTSIFKSKGYTSVRIEVSNKSYRHISIMGKKDDGNEVEIAPKFSSLSSGEVMVFALFISILKEYDKIFTNNSSLDDIKGIVLIDEIDMHLHSDLIKEVLPNSIKIFPKIQFIITSHSPYFLLGMKETFATNCQFVALPTGTIMNNIENFEEIKNCYSIIDDSYETILNNLNNLNTKVTNMTKPLIITEGKTDWKHFKHALIHFQNEGKFKDLDIDFLQHDYNLGDSGLENLLKNIAKISNTKKIIGVFDNDSKIGSKYEKTYHHFGNNVFGCSIKDFLGYYNCGISTELLYKPEDLVTKDENGRRLFLSNEFTETSHHLKSNKNIVCLNNTLLDAKKNNLIKIVDKEVFDSEENSLALSKEAFANNILNNSGNFANLDLSGFEPFFKIIESIIKK